MTDIAMNCPSCRQSYAGADGELRCRINGLKCSQALSDECKRYEREPGADDVEAPWYTGAWCLDQGRGD